MIASPVLSRSSTKIDPGDAHHLLPCSRDAGVRAASRRVSCKVGWKMAGRSQGDAAVAALCSLGVVNYRKFLSLPKLTPYSLVNIRLLP
jgi:hypothetical protein